MEIREACRLIIEAGDTPRELRLEFVEDMWTLKFSDSMVEMINTPWEPIQEWDYSLPDVVPQRRRGPLDPVNPPAPPAKRARVEVKKRKPRR